MPVPSSICNACAMHVIVITNRKGGTAKTTVAVNLAAELAARQLRVLLIDLDSQGHCAVGLGVRVEGASRTVHHLFRDPSARLADVIQETTVSNLSIAPADTLFNHGQGEGNDLRLKQAMADADLALRFDIVIIDTPPSLDALLINALHAGTRVMVPYVPHHLSFEGVRQLVRVLFPIMTGPNRALKVLGFLPTMASDSFRLHRSVNAAAAGDFGADRLLPAIRNDIKLSEAMGAGRPIRQFAPSSRGAQDFAGLADEVLRRLEMPQPSAAVG